MLYSIISSCRPQLIRHAVFLVVVLLASQSILPEVYADTISFSAFQDNIGRRKNIETRVVLTTAESYRNYFGHASPPLVNWRRDWVVFYSAGKEPFEGYIAGIADINTSPSGRKLRISTRLESPHPQCAVEKSTKPYALARFRRPEPRPLFVSFFQIKDFAPCDPPVCDSVLCAPGFVCESVQEACLVPPCPYRAQCVAAVDPCSEIVCAPGNVCVVENNIAQCVAPR